MSAIWKRMPGSLKRRLPAFLIIVLLTACAAVNRPSDAGSSQEAASAPAQETGAAEASSAEETAAVTDDDDLSGDENGPPADSGTDEPEEPEDGPEISVTEDGEYNTKDEVALYLHTYGHLPSNYITKKEAQALGWDSSKGNLDDVAPGKSIGGDRFGNYEGNLPEGHSYKECDIGYEGGYRGAERIVFSDDGLIFYTDDHYNTFEQLYY